MFTKKPLHLFLAIFVALGLFLSPFSMKHGFSGVKIPEHCMGSDSHHKSADKKELAKCCIAACAALFVTSSPLNFSFPLVKSVLVISEDKPLISETLDGLVRPPKSLS